MKQSPAFTRGFFLLTAIALLIIGLSQLILPSFYITALIDLPLTPFSLQLLGMGGCLLAMGMGLVVLHPERHAGLLFITCLMLLACSVLFLLHAASLSPAVLLFSGILLGWSILLAAIMLKIKPAMHSRPTASGSEADASEPLAKTLSRFRTQRGSNLLKLSNEQQVLLLFLEEKAFAGNCILSKMVSSAEKQLFSKLDRRSIATVYVHRYKEKRANEEFAYQGMNDVPRISDPNGLMYVAFNVQQKKREQAGLRDRITKIIPSSSEGTNGLAAAFLISKGQILKSSQTADFERILSPDNSHAQTA